MGGVLGAASSVCVCVRHPPPRPLWRGHWNKGCGCRGPVLRVNDKAGWLAGCMYPSSGRSTKGGCVSPAWTTQTHDVQAARQKRGEIIKRAEKYVKEYKKVS